MNLVIPNERPSSAHRIGVRASRTPWVAAVLSTALLQASCSSVPKPAVPDGSARVAANDPARIELIRQQSVLDRASMFENDKLKAELALVKKQVEDMRQLVRAALLLAPAPVASPGASGPAGSVAPAQPAAVPLKAAMAAASVGATDDAATSSLRSPDLDVVADGLVLRVFFPYGKTEFLPGDATSKLLLAAARDKARIEVRGHTDGRQASPGETLIATGRAARARSWLVSHGAQPEFIRTRIYVVGHHLADNATEQGRSLNRRVELEITRDANKVPGMPRPVSNAIRLNTPTIGDAA